MANTFYNRAKKEIADNTIDLLNDTIKVMLVDDTYTVNPDHDFVDMGGTADPIDAELSGTGYERKTLANKSITEDDANDRASFDADDVTWTSIDAGTANAAIIFKDTGDDTTSVLIAYIDDDFPITTNGGNLTIQWNADGIITLS